MCRLSMGDQDGAIESVNNSASEWPVTAVLHVIALAQVRHCIWAYLGRRGSKLSLDQDSLSYPVLEIIRQRRCA